MAIIQAGFMITYSSLLIFLMIVIEIKFKRNKLSGEVWPLGGSTSSRVGPGKSGGGVTGR